MSRVALRHVASAEHYSEALHSALSYVEVPQLRRGDRVFLKPNLISVQHHRGVSTSPALLKALVEWLADCGVRTTICESSGWLGRWTASEAFIGHGLDRLAHRHGLELLDLDTVARRMRKATVARTDLKLRLPARLLDDCEVLISVPVVKTHILTTVSLGMKNLYGCLPHPDRLLLHPQLPQTIVALCEALRPRLSISDGLFGMTGPGPTYGDVRPLHLLGVSENTPAGDEAICSAIGIDPSSVEHLVLARHQGLCSGTTSVSSEFRGPAERFRMTRGPRGMVAMAASRSRLVTRLLYLSPLSNVKDLAVKVVRR